LLEQMPGQEGQTGWLLAPDAVEWLARHDWPGNVRELRNVLERAAAMAPEDTIDGALVSRALPQLGLRQSATAAGLSGRMAEVERQALLDAIAVSKGSKSGAARHLGISRSQFYEKLKRHGL
jgi:transcriptional regulator of acetoin/glycerol metabolism